jgi:hypothetical protein
LGAGQLRRVSLNTYDVVKYAHILFLLIGIGAGAIIWACLFNLRAARRLADAGPWGALAGKTESVFPVVILGLFGTGAYMTSDVWTWSTGWIDVSIAALVLIAIQGGGVASRRAHALKHALMENGPGELREHARRMTRDPALWIASFANPSLVLGVTWNMTQKPGTGEAVAAVLVAYAVGVAVAIRFTRAPAVETAAAIEA